MAIANDCSMTLLVRSTTATTRPAASRADGMADQSVAVAVQIGEHDGLGLERSQSVGGPGSNPLAQVLVVALEIRGDGLQAGGGGLGLERGGRGRPRPARQFLVGQPQHVPQLAEHRPAALQAGDGVALRVQPFEGAQGLGGLLQQA